MFKKAVKAKSKLRLCVSGPSGSGKTMGALIIAEAIKGDGRIAFIDTENGSASLYADEFDFDVSEMSPPYTPESFVDAIVNAENEGYTVIIIDSATHEWEGDGGCLQSNQALADARFKGNTWAAWNVTTPKHQRFINAMVHSGVHVICTARSKTETTQENGKVRRLGMKLVQRDNFEYEFTLALDIVRDGHFANAIKDRTGLFAGRDPKKITAETGEMLIDWLNSGASVKQILKTCIEDINQADGMIDLKDRYTAAHRTLQPYADAKAIETITKAKDEMKDKLTNTD